MWFVNNDPINERIGKALWAYHDAHPDQDGRTTPNLSGNGEIQFNKEKAYAYAEWLEAAVRDGRTITGEDAITLFGFSEGIIN